ncbi:MAG: ABC transporter transmembrane domain-containing protein, partial [Defluviitaleaceae bacterium]|nr:ABC transporter transmembrane domain-containing protein [Defluviitaleaceae bacterium]
MEHFEEQDYDKGFDPKTWKKILQFCAAYKKLFVLLFVFAGGLAVVGAMFPILVGYAVENFVEARTLEGLPIFIGLFALAIVLQSFFVFAFIYVAGKIETNVATDVREKSFHHLQRLSFSYFDNTPTGWIMARLTSDTMSIGHIISWGAVDVIHGIILIIVCFSFMFVIHTQLAFIMLAIMPVLIVVSIYFQRKILKAHRESRKVNSKITGAYNEGITGAKTTKTLTREERNFGEFESLTGQMRRASIRAATFSGLYFPIILAISALGIAFIIGYGGGAILGGTMTLSTLVIFVAYVNQIEEPISQIARVLSEMQKAQASAERTISLLESTPDIVDRDDVIEKYGDFENPKPETWKKIEGNINFKDVSFTYKTGERVLESFNLNVRAGEKIALVGETGSGKSTITNLLCRFYEPTKGEILIDGMDYREHPQIWLQSNLGYVLQTPHLFSGSIEENIRYGNLDATKQDIEEAAKIVGAYDFITKMEDGFKTDVGEGGNRL